MGPWLGAGLWVSVEEIGGGGGIHVKKKKKAQQLLIKLDYDYYTIQQVS